MKRLSALTLFALLACTTDGPKFTPEKLDTLILQGGMPDESVMFERQIFTVTESGTVDFEMTTLEARNFVTGELFEDPALIVNFGLPGINAAGEETCQINIANFMFEGDSFPLGLSPAVYCLVLQRPDEVVIPATAIVTYTMTLTGAFS
ncbi:MAG: hypothetical protein P8Y44_01335 [Acidobacteriota bacterium]